MSSSSYTPKTDHRRKAISLETKINILNRLQCEGSTAVGKRFNLSEATIRTIKRNEEAIRKTVTAGSMQSALRSSYIRDEAVNRTEKALSLWIRDEYRRNRETIDGNVLRQKAIELHAKYKERVEETQKRKGKPFSASSGWLNGFLRRHSYEYIRQKGGPEDQQAEEGTGSGWEVEMVGSEMPGEMLADGSVDDQRQQRQEEEEEEKDAVGGSGGGGMGCLDEGTGEWKEPAKEKSPSTKQRPMPAKKARISKERVEADDDDDDADEPVPPLSASQIQQGVYIANILKNHFLMHDDDDARGEQFAKELDGCMARYEELYKNVQQ